MKSQARFKIYRDQALFRDLGFLLLAAGFFLVKVFEQPLADAMLYAPLVVVGSFALLVGGAHLILGALRLAEFIGDQIGLRPSRR